jgi:hypothetical protein
MVGRGLRNAAMAQGLKNREEGTGNREQGRGNREQRAGKNEQGIGKRREQGARRPTCAHFSLFPVPYSLPFCLSALFA